MVHYMPVFTYALFFYLGVLKVTMVKLGCFMVMLDIFNVTMVTSRLQTEENKISFPPMFVPNNIKVKLLF